MSTMQRSTFLKVRKARPRAVPNLGEYYILDAYTNVVVAKEPEPKSLVELLFENESDEDWEDLALRNGFLVSK